GGNTAIDVVRTLVRGETTPILVYRRRKKDMPAFQHEVDLAIKEGVQIIELVSPLEIQQQKGGYLLTLQQMKISGRDDMDRANAVPDRSGKQTLSVRAVFCAIGAQAGESWYLPADTADKRLNLSHTTFTMDNRPVIFGGDLTNRIKSVADAIASGKEAAMALDIYFKKGWQAIEQTIDECRVGGGPSLSMEIYRSGDRKERNPHIVLFDEINTDYFESSPRVPTTCGRNDMPTAPEPALSTEAAMKEAERCFNCGICNDCDNCRLFCPEMAVKRGDTREINMDYCKGCGICMTECPRNAIVLEEEKI
ncbi:MAG: 4Fe-4S binding protein, partial [Desulfobacterales bacterium]